MPASRYPHPKILLTNNGSCFSNKTVSNNNQEPVFNEEVVHGSDLNISSRTRLSVDMRFFKKNLVSEKHSLDLQEWQIINPQVIR